MAKSFVDRVQPNRPRERVIDWPFPCEGETPKLTLRILGADEMEGAYLDTIDHFKGRKPKVEISDPAFVEREKAAVVWRAYRDGKDRIADTVDDLAKQPHEIIVRLYHEWSAFQSDITAAPATKAEMDLLVEALKKNTQDFPLHALPLSWLVTLSRTLASQLVDSTPPNEPGL